ncbi:MAG: hypothetical protein ACXWQE_12975, partial [Bdellovibrionales bacterium]
MRWKILFAAVLWSQIGHAVPERCETLLEAKSVQAAAANLLDKKLSRKAVLGLRGHYDSMSRAEQTQLRKMFTTKPKPGAAEMWVESITMKQ